MAFDPLEQPPDEGEDWLISYADMMTLIACFFILMMAFANFEEVGFNKKAEQLSKHFRKDKAKPSEIKMKLLREEITKHETKTKKTKVSIKDSELIVNFSGSTLFKNAQAKLSTAAMDSVDSLVELIKSNNTQYRILVEGHADDYLKGSKYDSQWALSAARAATIVEVFQKFGFKVENLTAIAKGDTVKLVESVDKEGRMIEKNAKLNRRVVIRVLEPKTKKKIKMGLGVYFKDATDDVNEELNEAEINDYQRE